jgi:hypothetical protein
MQARATRLAPEDWPDWPIIAYGFALVVGAGGAALVFRRLAPSDLRSTGAAAPSYTAAMGAVVVAVSRSPTHW